MASTERADALAEAVALGAAAAIGTLLADMREFLQTRGADDRPEAGWDAANGFLRSIARRGDRLVAELLACAGRQELAPTAVEPMLLLHSMADLLRRTLHAGIEVAVEVDSGCPACHADARALDDALLKLVVNARDAMPEGGCLRLSAQGGGRLADGSRAVALSISDSGIGMAADVAERAALPFFTTKTNAPWAGMGLSAVRGFARQSGGSMAVRSSPNAGTTVTLYLPRHDNER